MNQIILETTVLTKEFIMAAEDRNITSEVEAVLDKYVRPYLAAHGGDLQATAIYADSTSFSVITRFVMRNAMT